MSERPGSARTPEPVGQEPQPALLSLLRCVECEGRLNEQPGGLTCADCDRHYPIVDGTPRMLPRSLAGEAGTDGPDAAVKRRTGGSFAYEWSKFGQVRDEWERNFTDYMRPHQPAFFTGRSVLDVGTGSGRHAREAARLGANVVAVDIGASIDTARENLPSEVLTVQADAEALPFEAGAFDFVMSIGVLHHLPDPSRALKGLVRYVRPGGTLHVYLYWQPELGPHRVILRGVSALRRITTRLPHRFLHLLCYPLAAVLFVAFVLPYRLLRSSQAFAPVARLLPLKAYADYPFGVLVNDQFDRFSAPIEHRYTRQEAEEMMRAADLVDVTVLPNHGWVADGRRPVDDDG